MIGQKVGPYELIEELGRGGMATVYLAVQSSVDRNVAIKLIHQTFAADESMVARFMSEARLIAKLEHPHILPVYDFDGNHDPPYIVMRYLPTGTLSDIMKKATLPSGEVLHIFRQMGSALDYAHRSGVVHRDIKPSNIMIDEEGNAFVMDFGIARMMEGGANLTATGAAVGTPGYMSPEQGMGKKVDGRSDIYAMGVMLFEMMSGKLPFMAETPYAVIFKHINDPIPQILEHNEELPPALQDVLDRALAKSPEDRFQSAADMVHELSLVLGPNTSTRPIELRELAGETVVELAKKRAEKRKLQEEEATNMLADDSPVPAPKPATFGTNMEAQRARRTYGEVEQGQDAATDATGPSQQQWLLAGAGVGAILILGTIVALLVFGGDGGSSESTDTDTDTPTYTLTFTTEPTTEEPSLTPTTAVAVAEDTEEPTEAVSETEEATEEVSETPTEAPTDAEGNGPGGPGGQPTELPTELPTRDSTGPNQENITPTEDATEAATEQPTNTDVPTDTPTATDTPTNTLTPTFTETPTNTPTDTPTHTATYTPSLTPTPATPIGVINALVVEVRLGPDLAYPAIGQLTSGTEFFFLAITGDSQWVQIGYTAPDGTPFTGFVQSSAVQLLGGNLLTLPTPVYPTLTFTPSATYTETPSETPTPSQTMTPSQTPTFTPTDTFTPSHTPTNTLTLTPSITPTAALGDIPYAVDLTAPDALDSWFYNTDQWRIQEVSGVTALLGNTGINDTAVMLADLDPVWLETTDLTYSFRFIVLDQRTAARFVFSLSRNGYYVFEGRQNALFLKRNDSNTINRAFETDLQGDNSEAGIVVGQWYSIRIDREGINMRVYLDGELVMEAADAQPLVPGEIQLQSLSPVDGVYAGFADIVIEPLRDDVPTPIE